MLEEEIYKILSSENKSHQWKAIQLQNLGNHIYDQFNREDFKRNFEKLAPEIRIEIENRKLQVYEIEKIINENEAILEQKEEIERKYNQLKTESDKLDELKRKNDALKNFSKVQSEVFTTMNEKDTLVKKHLETLTALNQVLANANTDLEKQLASKTKEAVNNLNAILVTLDTTQFKAKFPVLAKNVDDLIMDHNHHVEKIKTVKTHLEEISLKHDSVITVFNRHHLENENIFGALKNREGVLQYVQNISNEISERLKQYDSEIKTLIEKRDQLPIYQLAETRKYQ